MPDTPLLYWLPVNLLKPPLPPDYLVQIEGTDRGTGTPVHGTGVVLARDLILTCRHVVTSHQSVHALKNIKVTINGEEFTTTREHCSDAKTDLAVLKLQPKDKQSLPEVERPNWEWPQGKLKGEDLFLRGFPNKTYYSEAHPIQLKTETTIQMTGGVEEGISGGVAEYAIHPPNYCCVGIVQVTDFSVAKVIAMPVIERFLTEHGLDGILSKQDPARYLAYLDKETKHIELPALGVTGTERFVLIKDLWVPSRTRSGGLLSDALNQNRVLVVEGLAGSGKSTFLRRAVHAMLHPDQDDLKVHYKSPPLWVQVTQFETYLAERYPDARPGPRIRVGSRNVSPGKARSGTGTSQKPTLRKSSATPKPSSFSTDSMKPPRPGARRWRSYSKKPSTRSPAGWC